MPRSVHTRLEVLERSVVASLPRQESAGMRVVAEMLGQIKDARMSGFESEELNTARSELQRFLKDRRNGALKAGSEETRSAARRVSEAFALFVEAFDAWNIGG